MDLRGAGDGMNEPAYRTITKVLQVPKRLKLDVTDVQEFGEGYSARLWTKARKATVKGWLKEAGITKYRLQKILGERVTYYRIEFEVSP